MQPSTQALLSWYRAGADGRVNWAASNPMGQVKTVASQYLTVVQVAKLCAALTETSDSVKKSQVAELAVIGRYLKRGGEIAKFKPAALDEEQMRLLCADMASVGTATALTAARERVGKNFSVSAPLATGIAPFDLDGTQPEGRRCSCGSPMTRFEMGPTCTNCQIQAIAPVEKGYSDDEARDAHGQWTSGGSEQLGLPGVADHRSKLNEWLGYGGMGNATRMSGEKEGRGVFQAPSSRPGFTAHGQWQANPSGSMSTWAIDILLPDSVDAAWARDAKKATTPDLLKMVEAELAKRGALTPDPSGPILAKGNENHEPAGSPEGGRFAAADGGASDGPLHQEFKNAIDAALPPGHPQHLYVNHYTVEEMKGMTPLLRNDGRTGVLIHDHRDGSVEATALFNVGPKGGGSALLREAIDKHGVNYVECLGDGLAKYYGTFGFQVSTSEPFDPAKAVDGWDTATMGTPDYYTMRLAK